MFEMSSEVIKFMTVRTASFGQPAYNALICLYKGVVGCSASLLLGLHFSSSNHKWVATLVYCKLWYLSCRLEDGFQWTWHR